MNSEHDERVPADKSSLSLEIPAQLTSIDEKVFKVSSACLIFYKYDQRDKNVVERMLQSNVVERMLQSFQHRDGDVQT